MYPTQCPPHVLKIILWSHVEQHHLFMYILGQATNQQKLEHVIIKRKKKKFILNSLVYN